MLERNLVKIFSISCPQCRTGSELCGCKSSGTEALLHLERRPICSKYLKNERGEFALPSFTTIELPNSFLYSDNAVKNFRFVFQAPLNPARIARRNWNNNNTSVQYLYRQVVHATFKIYYIHESEYFTKVGNTSYHFMQTKIVLWNVAITFEGKKHLNAQLHCICKKWVVQTVLTASEMPCASWYCICIYIFILHFFLKSHR